MFKALYFYFKIIWLLVTRRTVPSNLIKDDYDLLAPTYDEYFSKFVEPNSKELVRRLDIRNNSAIALDLACGTGTLTLELNKYIGLRGKIISIDLSEKMIGKAKEKISSKNSNVEFLVGDMENTLNGFSSNYFDYVTSGWSIGYSDPLKLSRMISRILRHHGKLGVIENRSDTLSPLKEVALKVARRYPEYIRYIMDLPLRLPQDKSYLKKIFLKSGLKPLEIWEGEIKFHFDDGKEVLNWVLHTGASAGFDRMMDLSVKDRCDDAFIEFMEKDYKNEDGITISHRFIAGIAQKA